METTLQGLPVHGTFETRFKVLDYGFISLVDHMGNDSSIVQAARVSYGSGTKSLREDEGLINYLMKNSHTSPFEMVVFKFFIKCPMDVWRQWIRHRTASVNEYSTRYSIVEDEMMQTEPTAWRIQSDKNKQGSAAKFLDEDKGMHLTMREKELHKLAWKVYNERIELGVAREQARKDLPLSTYTQAYWQINLHNLLHFLELRMDSHAQLEIRTYANHIGEIVEHICPLTWKAFLTHHFDISTHTRRLPSNG